MCEITGHQIFKDKTFLCELYACCFSCRSFKEPRMAFKKANWQRRFNLPFDRIQNENKIKPRVEGNPIYREVSIEWWCNRKVLSVWCCFMLILLKLHWKVLMFNLIHPNIIYINLKYAQVNWNVLHWMVDFLKSQNNI